MCRILLLRNNCILYIWPMLYYCIKKYCIDLRDYVIGMRKTNRRRSKGNSLFIFILSIQIKQIYYKNVTENLIFSIVTILEPCNVYKCFIFVIFFFTRKCSNYSCSIPSFIMTPKSLCAYNKIRLLFEFPTNVIPNWIQTEKSIQ